MVAASDGENIGTDSYSFWLLTRALKLSVTGLGIFGAITIVRRSNRGQMWSIRRAMRRRAQRHHQGLGSALLPADWPKHAIHVPIPSSAALSSLLKEPPMSPIVVVGPESCGASAVVEEALRSAGTMSLLQLNLNEAASSTSILWAFVRESGFFLIPESWQDLRLVSGSSKESEIERCLRLHAKVFEEGTLLQQAQTSRVGYAPRPVICVDQLHSRHLASQDKAEFDRFLNWALHLTDRSLAHVIVVTRPDVVNTLDQTHTPFAQRRHCLWLDFAKPCVIQQRLLETFGQGGTDTEGWAKTLSPRDAAMIARGVGGQLKDLRTVCNAIHRFSDPTELLLQPTHGLGWHRLYGSLIAQSMAQLEQRLEDDLQRAAELHYSGDRGEALWQAYQRPQRYWSLMEVLAARGHILRSEVIATTYGAFAHELDELLSDGIVTVMPLFLRAGSNNSDRGDSSSDERASGVPAVAPTDENFGKVKEGGADLYGIEDKAEEIDGVNARDFAVSCADAGQSCLVVTAGSPRKLQAMRHVVANPRMLELMGTVNRRVRQLKLRRRHIQLDDRRTEMAASLRALLHAGTPTDGVALAEMTRLLREMAACGTELEAVRKELDAM